jgi:hypothetical protein
LPYDERLDFFGSRNHQIRIRRHLRLRESHHEPIICPHRFDVEAGFRSGALDRCHRPGSVNAATEWREHADAPIAQLVAAALDQDGPVIRNDTRGRSLVREVPQQVLGCLAVEIVVLDEPLHGGRRRHMTERSNQFSDLAPQLQRPARRVRLPERHLSRFTGSRGDEHPIVRDLFDPPGRCTKQERLADAALEYHFLVELADAGMRSTFADEEYAIQAAIGNGPAVDDGDPLCAFARRQLVLQSIPREPWTQIGEIVRWIAPREHVEYALVDRSTEIGKGRRAPDRVEQRIDIPVVHRDHRDDLLRKHVERIPRVAARLDARFVHRAGDRCTRDQISAELRDDDATACGADGMACSSDALHAAGHRRRGFNLDDKIDGAHVDPQLER